MNGLSLLDSLFDSDGWTFQTARNAYSAPKADVLQKKDSYLLSMDLPGKKEDDIEITYKDHVLTIASTEKPAEEKAEENKTVWLIRERTAENAWFRRSFTMPEDVDGSKITATFKNGVLAIEIGRKAAEQEQKIKVIAA